ncbi:hypothetical protein IWQ61_004429 [Dispira simplex]|nr:hypothetical protein IWQ61_004429 [Dispira simplex]
MSTNDLYATEASLVAAELDIYQAYVKAGRMHQPEWLPVPPTVTPATLEIKSSLDQAMTDLEIDQWQYELTQW